MRRIGYVLSGTALCALSLVAVGGVAPGAVQSAAPTHSHGVMIPAPSPQGGLQPLTGTHDQSTNWSGYAQSAGKSTGPFTGTEATFVVPKVAEPKKGVEYSADWVGIGGFSEGTLVQDGIEVDNVNGKPLYRAWTEIIPAPEVPLVLTIHPGDMMQALVRETAVNTWSMTVEDLTLGTQANRTVSYHSSGASAEAILERPQVGGALANLAKTGEAVFDPGGVSTTPPGGTAVYTPFLTPLTGQTLHDIAMVNNAATKVIATPSNADSDSDGFSVNDGAAVPAPPAS